MSSFMRAYEIHTFTGGKWKIDSVFDDRDLAVFEATRMDESGRHAGVRVIEEEFDETTQKTRIRTVYRGSKIEAGNAAALERAKETRVKVAAAKAEIANERQRQKVEAVRAEKARKTNPYRLVSVFAVIAAIGLGAVIGLRFLYDIL
jgi:hypothetical protein